VASSIPLAKVRLELAHGFDGVRVAAALCISSES